MATGKRYYWIKLRESFMTSDTVDYLMSQPDGANYVVLYLMLCLKTVNTNGRLASKIGEIIIPYDVEKIQRDCKWFSTDTIRVALNLYKSFGLVYEDVDGTLMMADHNEMVGSETDWAKQKRDQLERKTTGLLASGNDAESGVENIHTEIRNKRLEIRDRDNIKNTSYSCSEPEESVSKPHESAVISVPLNDGTEHSVTQTDIDKYTSLYPAVDVMQELRKMVGWLDGNPTRKKTRRGIKRFINGWLAREQDKGGLRPPAPTTQPQQNAFGLDRRTNKTPEKYGGGIVV